MCYKFNKKLKTIAYIHKLMYTLLRQTLIYKKSLLPKVTNFLKKNNKFLKTWNCQIRTTMNILMFLRLGPFSLFLTLIKFIVVLFISLLETTWLVLYGCQSSKRSVESWLGPYRMTEVYSYQRNLIRVSYLLLVVIAFYE